MLSIFAKTFKTATRQDKWDAPDHFRSPSRRPISDREAERIDQFRRSLHYRAPW